MTVLLGLLALVVWLLTTVFGNLVSNQIEAWLPRLARWMARRNARRRSSRAESCEEEWLAHVDATAGGLAKVFVAVSLSWAPWQTLIELWRDRRLDTRAILSYTGAVPILFVIAGTILLFVRFPPSPSYYAAYAVAFLCC